MFSIHGDFRNLRFPSFPDLEAQNHQCSTKHMSYVSCFVKLVSDSTSLKFIGRVKPSNLFSSEIDEMSNSVTAGQFCINSREHRMVDKISEVDKPRKNFTETNVSENGNLLDGAT